LVIRVEATSLFDDFILSTVFRALRNSTGRSNLSSPYLTENRELAFKIAAFDFLADTLNICIE